MDCLSLINRVALHLRPDPSRVVVRAFRPAVEPRELSPIDQARANHLVSRLMRLSEEEAAA